jgi:hypothetical protein
MTGPEFSDLVGEDVTEEERHRLERVHRLLVQAGPPPELSPSLAETPVPPGRVVSLLPRRRRSALLILAASLAAAAFGAGYFTGHKTNEGFTSAFSVEMRGTASAPAALASVQIGSKDAGGNWPMVVVVRGLKELPAGGYYELWLTRGSRRIASCGTFRVHGKTTTVQLNTPLLATGDGWKLVANPGNATVMTSV